MEVRHRNQIREKQTTPGQYDLEFYKSYNYEDTKNVNINHYPSTRKPDYFRKEYNDINLLSPVNYEGTSRYETIKTIKELGKQYHATNRLRGVRTSDGDVYHVVTNMTQNRLDLISLMYYNTASYWWIIAHANNIFDSLTQIPVGRKLRIPALNSIINHYTK